MKSSSEIEVGKGKNYLLKSSGAVQAPKSRPLTVGIDLDDTLFEFAPHFIKWSNKNFGTSLQSRNYDEHWAGPTIWNLEDDWDELMRRYHMLIESKFYLNLPLLPYAKRAIKSLKAHGVRLFIVTNRSADTNRHRRLIQQHSIASILRHFPKDSFAKIVFLDVWGSNSRAPHRISKKEACRELGLDYMIDDQLKHVLALEKAPRRHNNARRPRDDFGRTGTRGILFGDYPQNTTAPSHILRFSGWNDEKIINVLTK